MVVEKSLMERKKLVGDKILYTLLLPGGAENVTFTPDVTNWNTQTTPEANEAQ